MALRVDYVGDPVDSVRYPVVDAGLASLRTGVARWHDADQEPARTLLHHQRPSGVALCTHSYHWRHTELKYGSNLRNKPFAKLLHNSCFRQTECVLKCQVLIVNENVCFDDIMYQNLHCSVKLVLNCCRQLDFNYLGQQYTHIGR